MGLSQATSLSPASGHSAEHREAVAAAKGTGSQLDATMERTETASRASLLRRRRRRRRMLQPHRDNDVAVQEIAPWISDEPANGLGI